MRALVTGGAGFIGSNLADHLLTEGWEVVVLDDLSMGRPDNVPGAARLIVGDLADVATVREAATGCDVVFHLGAHRAVLRSVEDPLASDRANVRGTLAVLTAARDVGVRRVVTASSSSVYGGAEQMPTPESAPLRPRSPYAVSKAAGEMYASVYSDLYGLETVALRYFNVYGARQRADSAYATVIPLFVQAVRDGGLVTIHGTGEQSRDFTHVSDVVRATVAAATAPADRCSGQVFNVAVGRSHSLLDLLGMLEEITGREAKIEHIESRAGDVMHTCADVTAARLALGFSARVPMREGLELTATWLADQLGDAALADASQLLQRGAS